MGNFRHFITKQLIAIYTKFSSCNVYRLNMFLNVVLVLCLVYSVTNVSADVRIQITSTSPVISGGVVNFTAELYDGDQRAKGSFQYDWEDNSLIRHRRKVDSDQPIDKWSVNYTAADCPPGVYVMQVTVYKYYLLIPIVLASERYLFYLTNTLNGDLILSQKNQTVTSSYVSNSTSVVHEVKLKPADMQFLNNSASEILTYWFIDCEYYGITSDMKFEYNYSMVDQQHTIDAFVMPNFEPFPTEAPTTTTTTTTTTSSTPTKSLPTSAKKRRRRDTSLITNFQSESDIIYKSLNKKDLAANGTMKYNNSFPFICKNHTIVPMPTNTPYGYFTKTVKVKEPIKGISVSGNNWLQRSEVLHLQVTCNGSSIFQYCYYFMNGQYNVTGNETCPSIIHTSYSCQFPITRYFYDDNARTIVIIISNDVSKEVYPVTVTIYKVNKQAQVSVVVVPVGFSLIAIVLIIFGVAFYFQHRSRFTIEVADFNFGQQFGELEYKTFSERLKDAFSNAFTRAPIPSGSSDGSAWHTGEGGVNKYNSMS